MKTQPLKQLLYTLAMESKLQNFENEKICQD